MTTPKTWHCRSWERLERDEIHAIFAARQAVFVVEQECAYLDVDGLDPRCEHLWTEHVDGVLAAYARLLPPGVKHADAVSIGRVLTTAAARGRGLGRELMVEALRICAERWPAKPVRLDAQDYLRRFYAELGFGACGEVFEEDGIPHVEMERPAGPPPLS